MARTCAGLQVWRCASSARVSSPFASIRALFGGCDEGNGTRRRINAKTRPTYSIHGCLSLLHTTRVMPINRPPRPRRRPRRRLRLAASVLCDPPRASLPCPSPRGISGARWSSLEPRGGGGGWAEETSSCAAVSVAYRLPPVPRRGTRGRVRVAGHRPAHCSCVYFAKQYICPLCG